MNSCFIKPLYLEYIKYDKSTEDEIMRRFNVTLNENNDLSIKGCGVVNVGDYIVISIECGVIGVYGEKQFKQLFCTGRLL